MFHPEIVGILYKLKKNASEAFTRGCEDPNLPNGDKIIHNVNHYNSISSLSHCQIRHYD